MNSTQNRTTPAADELACQAAAVFVAKAAYTTALETDEPAGTLDNIADALPEVMPKVLDIVHTSPELADTLQTSIADQLWAYSAIEHARVEAGDGYGYVFDLLADDLKAGRDPHLARKTALDVPGRLRALAEAARG
ncbi:hypothetical protein [Streptomyces canus]|uniref:hypothetical protein n=1 Tax=Streptomyces canus TaxID=58343 RepID=UPI002251E22A|nr:hypothetical protein [Streptomyces canus]MCX4858971.1 hypothetical protein [Streptomyces canus]